MPRFFIILTGLFILVFLVGLSLAGIPKLINYQGMLTDNSGNPLTGSYNLTFKIWTDTTGGSSIWDETHAVSVQNGLYNVILGQMTALDLPFDQQYWLEVQVGAETMPRLRFTSVGYAYRAQKADTAEYARGGGGGSGSPWIFRTSDGSDTTITTGGCWGVARFGNQLFGNADSTHVNLGVACTTGTNGQNYKYCTIGGGWRNTSGNFATVGGGSRNTASGSSSTVGGGGANSASGGGATVAGGDYDTASADIATVGGGSNNTASGYGATAGGGLRNSASARYATVGGGDENTASRGFATVGGGETNAASESSATVGGGGFNTASGYSAIVGGGINNTASGGNATVGGGYTNTASYPYATVGGGEYNKASGYGATVGGGYGDTASESYATVGGGYGNTSGNNATVGGGAQNTASGGNATVGGGLLNTAGGNYATVGGGWYNTSSYSATVGGGCGNTASGSYSVIPGGDHDTITLLGNYSMIFGKGVYVNNTYRVVFFDGNSSGRLGINRDDRNGGISYPIHVGTGTGNGNGAYLTNGGVWTNGSSRTFKENFQPLNSQELLEKISSLPVEAWNFKNSDERHIGPLAEDFVLAFDVGTVREDGARDNKYLSTEDIAGVALAGVKELINENQELTRIIKEQQKDIQLLKEEIKVLRIDKR